MKIVINIQFGGFGLSPAAVKRLAELRGRKCFFFKHVTGMKYRRVVEGAEGFCGDLFWSAFDVPELPDEMDNDFFKVHYLTNNPDERTDPLLIRVVWELGRKSWGACAELKIVEVPNGVKWEISEYDGLEHVAEIHRTWC
jgi:hypothetical protein